MGSVSLFSLMKYTRRVVIVAHSTSCGFSNGHISCNALVDTMQFQGSALCQSDLGELCDLRVDAQQRVSRDGEPDWHKITYVMACGGGYIPLALHKTCHSLNCLDNTLQTDSRHIRSHLFTKKFGFFPEKQHRGPPLGAPGKGSTSPRDCNVVGKYPLPRP